MSSRPFLHGLHLIADLTARERLDDPDFIAAVLRDAAAAAKVTLLELRLHHFGEGGGVTGVALLAESHISIHTWPEDNLAAVDIFVCGAQADPEAALTEMTSALAAKVLKVARIERLAGSISDTS
ncbi:adenosylmethionine decarboxylase [Sphingopyxis sp. BSN-002]|uniref:adenosylmethionine decarboxylase n=1 Tax=Sphingopyxis sp. BSN-002 TaxID=2911495 RepID=UPI001EDB0EEF|nr:adenosylmethionine decarboxylase [Sphingopyxis sp. BSN-002]UKK84832.1 adenosylmethionine decarboxylase [Sphingopyxis sp. BSN-002]